MDLAYTVLFTVTKQKQLRLNSPLWKMLYSVPILIGLAPNTVQAGFPLIYVSR